MRKFWKTDDALGVRVWVGGKQPTGGIEITETEAEALLPEIPRPPPSRQAAYALFADNIGQSITMESVIALSHWRDTGIVMAATQVVPGGNGLEETTEISAGQLQDHLNALNALGDGWQAVGGGFSTR